MKITKRQLRRIIREEVNRLNESYEYRDREDESYAYYDRDEDEPYGFREMAEEEVRRQSLEDTMDHIKDQLSSIEDALEGGRYDYDDMYNEDTGSIAWLNAIIDAAREKAAEEGVPFEEPESSYLF